MEESKKFKTLIYICSILYGMLILLTPIETADTPTVYLSNYVTIEEIPYHLLDDPEVEISVNY